MIAMPEPMPTPDIDWKHVAVQLFRSDGQCYRLNTPERDALEAADSEAPNDDETLFARQLSDAREHGGFIA